MAVIREGKENNHYDVLNHSRNSIPEEFRKDILKSRDNEGYKLRCRHFVDDGMAGHFVHAVRELLYAHGLNGNQEVKYKPREEIYISPRGTSKLKFIFGSLLQ